MWQRNWHMEDKRLGGEIMFLSGLFYYVIRFICFTAFVCGGVFLGIKIRKNKDANMTIEKK